MQHLTRVPKTTIRAAQASDGLFMILNFYRSTRTVPALRQATKIIAGTTDTYSKAETETEWHLRRIFLDLIPKTFEENGETYAKRRLTFEKGGAPALRPWEQDLFRQLLEEYQKEGSGFFARWVLKRTGLIGLTDPFCSRPRAAVLFTSKTESKRKARFKKEPKAKLLESPPGDLPLKKIQGTENRFEPGCNLEGRRPVHLN